uniref:Uncharacterized protein n=1 Tax=Pyxicephalus adspersus TaxID=30357 RepID=A0AAV3AZ41_PYXAD|nr:TPA: hypothetical protein GDO54_001849 [Pyxicephalus adspersus]
MGHTLVHVLVYRVGEGYVPLKTNPAIPLHRTFYNPAWVIHGGGIDPLMRGMLVNSAKINRQYQIMSDELRDHLFESTNKLGLDLAAINIQRGRERGLPDIDHFLFKDQLYCSLI